MLASQSALQRSRFGCPTRYLNIRTLRTTEISRHANLENCKALVLGFSQLKNVQESFKAMNAREGLRAYSFPRSWYVPECFWNVVISRHQVCLSQSCPNNYQSHVFTEVAEMLTHIVSPVRTYNAVRNAACFYLGHGFHGLLVDFFGNLSMNQMNQYTC